MTSLLPPIWHPDLYGVLIVGVLVYALATRPERFRSTRRLRARFALAVVVLLVAYGWPLGDLAAHVSLSALVVQRILVLLCVAPLLMASLPVHLAVALTRPAPIDRIVATASRAPIAVLVVTVAGTASLIPATLAWSSRSPGAGALLAVVNLALGVVLWLPILTTAPGAKRLRNVGKGLYLIASSLIVTSLSIVWIFARHPMYGSFSRQHSILGLSPIVDQQLAGFIAKLGAYIPMWAIAFALLARDSAEEADEEPLRWVDVQREFERGERRSHGQVL